ncbi:unnamed protein product, partial [Oppiella nova]
MLTAGILSFTYLILSLKNKQIIPSRLQISAEILYGFVKHGIHFLSLFLPHGTPWWLAPLMITIELFAYLARPVSLSLRLAANMIAGCSRFIGVGFMAIGMLGAALGPVILQKLNNYKDSLLLELVLQKLWDCFHL